MIKFLQRFRKIRLQSQLFLICSIVLIVMLLCTSVFISIPTMNIITEDYIQASRRDMALISNVVESTLSHLFNYSVSIASDSRVITATLQNPNGLSEDPDSVRLRRTLSQSIRSIIGTNADIYKYDVFSCNGIPFNLCGNTYLYGLDTYLTSEFFMAASTTLAPQVHGPYSVVTPSSDRLPVYVITKSIVDLNTHKPYGVLVLLIRETRFSNPFSKLSRDSDVSYFIVNEDLCIISCADDSHLGEQIGYHFQLSPSEIQSLRTRGQCITPYKSSNTLFMLSGVVNPRTNWHILMATSMHRSQIARVQVFSSILLIAVMSCIVLLITSYTLSRGISRPIYRLVDAIHNDMKSDSMQYLSIPEASPEIELLYKTYNELNAHIVTLLDHINQEQEEKSNIKFKLIQAQIKPHFLYNTLMTIKSLIDLDMNETASECVYAMSSFYRLSLNKGNEILRLGDEIELSMQYMYIQKLRYIDRLDYVFDVPHTLYDYFVPKMTIQPILENAIYHGVKEKADKGIIQVTGRDLGDCMEFTITDNGRGMDSDTLARLQASLNSIGDEIHPRSESFGLYSVNRRIHMLYGKPYGLHVDSRLGEYTMVTLTLPKSTSIGGIS